MNGILNNKKFLPKAFITFLAVFIVITITMHWPSSPNFAIPIYLIYSSESEFGETDKEKIRGWLGLESKDSELKILDEGADQILATTTRLLTQLERGLKEGAMKKQLFSLAQPYSVNKKILRRDIETKFSGSDRIDALRSVIVVIGLKEPDTNNLYELHLKQFKDDLVYIEDNFGGVGLLIHNMELKYFERYIEIIYEILAVRN